MAAMGMVTIFRRCLHRVAGLAPAPEEADLLECFLGGRDQAAFAALVARHGPMVLGVCRRLLRHEHDAEDAFQATFLVLASKAASIRRPQALGGWLYRIAYHVCSQARAAAARRRRVLQELPMDRIVANDGVDAVQIAESATVLDDELMCLPEKYRSALVVCELEGLTHEEAARALGHPVGSMSRLLARGRELLKARLVKRGLGPAYGLAAVLTESARAAVPAVLADATVQSALGFLGLAGAAPCAPVLTLAKGAMYSMFLRKIKVGIACVMVACVVAASGAAIALQARGSDVADAAKEKASLPQPHALPTQPKMATKEPDLDLTKLSRAPTKEPKYRGSPCYGMLVLGREATLQIRFVFDGEILYIDRKGNGDLTDPQARLTPTETHHESSVTDGHVYDLGELEDPITKRKYTRVKLGRVAVKPGFKPKTDEEADRLAMLKKDDPEFVETGTITISLYHNKHAWIGSMGGGLKPGSASILHLDGPLVFRVVDFDDLPFELRIGEDIPIQLGTPGLGKKTFASVVHDIAPKDSHPLVEVEFQNIERGKPPVKTTFHLKQRC